MGNKRRNHLNLRQTSTTHGDVNKKQMLSFKELDDNFIFLKERDVKDIKLTGNDLVYKTLGGDEITVDLSSLGGGGSSLWTESGDDIKFTTGNVGIGTNPHSTYKLRVSGGIVYSQSGFKSVMGEYSVGNSIIKGSGGSSSGVFSATLGAGNIASGRQTLAIGQDTEASGDYSFAGGRSGSNSTIYASGQASFAFLRSERDFPVGAMSKYSVVLGGIDNIVKDSSNSSTILGGEINTISGDSRNCTILGGEENLIHGDSEYCAILGGSQNAIESPFKENSVIIGGQNNTMQGERSVILGGQNITANANDTTYVSKLNIGSVGSETANKLLAVDSNGKVVDGSSLASGGGGDVSKVGTPANNQVGVWTGDGTIEGDSKFTWNGTTLEVANADHYSRIHPDYLYQLNESADANLLLYTKSNGASVGSEIVFGRWNGTIGSESPLVSGQLISAQRMMGSYDVSNPTNATTGALIELRAAENWTTTTKGVRYSIDTAAIGENATTERFAIDSDGSVKIASELNIGSVGSGTANKLLAVDSSGKVVDGASLAGAGDVFVGSYSSGRVSRWDTTTNTLTTSIIRDDGDTIGINQDPVSWGKLYIKSTSSDETTTLYSLKSGSVSNANVFALRGYSSASASNSSNKIIAGVYGHSNILTGSLLGNYVGGYFRHGDQIDNTTGTGTKDAAGVFVSVDSQFPMVNMYGIKIDRMDITHTLTGGVYGLRINAFTGSGNAAGGKYGIYQDGSVETNHFNGATTINNDLTVTTLASATNLAADSNGKLISVPSDSNLKENITSIESGVLDKIKQIKTYKFNFVEELNMGDGDHFGHIAQEVQEIYPELITNRAGDEEHLTLNYVEMVPLLLQAIKEQQSIIDEIKNDLEVLKNK